MYDVYTRPLPATVIVAKSLPSVVAITCTFTRGTNHLTALSSGFVVSNDGHILSTAHGLTGCIDRKNKRFKGIEVYYWDESPKNGLHIEPIAHAALVLKYNEYLDLALIQVFSGPEVSPLDIDDSPSYALGSDIISIGHPEGNTWTVQEGIVSAERRYQQMFSKRAVQISAATNPGNSGGPVFDNKGNVIGLVSFNWGGNPTLGFITPGETLRAFIQGFF